MSSITFILLNGEKYENSFNRKKYHELLMQISEDIDIQLSQNKPYFVKSKVENENFNKFLDYWYEGKEPIITHENVFDFFLLSNEFGLMKDLISKSNEDATIILSCLKNLDQSTTTKKPNSYDVFDKSSYEEFVARNLGQIIIEYPELLQQVPIQSLYNIFNHKEKKLGDPINAFNFIINSTENYPNITILLQLLDMLELPKEIVTECISNHKDLLQYLPKNYNLFVENLIDENQKLKQKLNSEIFTKRKYCREIKLNDEKDDGIVAYLAQQSSKYERKFVVSLSSNDPYNVICPNIKKFDGFRSNTKSTNFPKEPGRNSSFTIEIKDPELVHSIKFYGTDKNDSFVNAFSYQINDDEEIDVTPEEAKIFQNADKTNRIITKIIDPPVIISKIKITPKGLENEGMTWPFFGGLELFSNEHPNGVFKSLIESSEHKDPHRCGVFIDATYYSTNLFYHFQDDFPNGLYVATDHLQGSWFKIELIEGLALINGYILQKIDKYYLSNYTIKITDDINKDEKDWITLCEEKDEKSFIMKKVFDKYYPVKAIKIISTGKAFNNKEQKEAFESMAFSHFDIYGLYFPSF